MVLGEAHPTETTVHSPVARKPRPFLQMVNTRAGLSRREIAGPYSGPQAKDTNTLNPHSRATPIAPRGASPCPLAPVGSTRTAATSNCCGRALAPGQALLFRQQLQMGQQAGTILAGPAEKVSKFAEEGWVSG